MISPVNLYDSGGVSAKVSASQKLCMIKLRYGYEYQFKIYPQKLIKQIIPRKQIGVVYWDDYDPNNENDENFITYYVDENHPRQNANCMLCYGRDDKYRPVYVTLDLRDVPDSLIGTSWMFDRLPEILWPNTIEVQLASDIKIRGYAVDGMSERELQSFNMDIYRAEDTTFVARTSQWGSDDGRRFAEAQMKCVEGKYLAKFTARKYVEQRDALGGSVNTAVNDPAYGPEWMEFELGDEHYDTERLTLPTAMMRKPRKSVNLDELVVKPSRIMFYHKGDTLVYNADAFVLAEGSTLDALLEQLPGVEMHSDGVIYCNGRRVDNLLLNGKDLFNGNRKLMLENLPYYTVKNISVYDKTGRDSELMDMKVPGDTKYVMDVRLRRQYSMGWLLNADLGAGTRERYLAKLFAMWFSDNVSVTAYAGANNLADAGKPGEKDGSWNRERMGDGVATRQHGGLIYHAQGHASKWELKGSADVEHMTEDSRTRTRQTNFLGSGDTYRYAWNDDNAESLTVSSKHSAFFKLGKRANLYVDPSVKYVKRHNTGNSTDATFNDEVAEISRDRIRSIYEGADGLTEIMLNRRLAEWLTDGESLDGGVKARSTIRTKSTGQKNSLQLSASADFGRNWSDRFNRYSIDYGQNPQGVLRYQYFKSRPNHDRKYGAGAKFTQYFKWKNSTLPVRYEFTRHEQTRTSSLYYLDRAKDFDAAEAGIGILPSESQYQSTIDPAQSYESHLADNRHTVEVEFRHNSVIMLTKQTKGGVGFSVAGRMGLTVADRDYQYSRPTFAPIRIDRTSAAMDYFVHATILTLPGRGYMNVLGLTLRGQGTFAPMKDLIDVTDDTDPLNIVTGNPSLRNPYHHSAMLDFSNQTTSHKHTVALNGHLFSNQIARGFYYNTLTGSRTVRPYNVDGNASASGSYEFFLNFGHRKAFDFTTKTSASYRRSVDMVGTTTEAVPDFSVAPPTRRVNTVGLSESLKLNWKIGKHRVSAFADANWNDYTGHDSGFSDFSAWNMKYGASGVCNLPRNWSISTDLNLYTRRGYSDAALNTTDLVWNARVSKSILKGSLVFALDAYDLLRQLNNVTYTVNAQARTETVSNVIPSYLLFHIYYRFNKQPKR